MQDLPEIEFKLPPLPTTLGEILQVLSREAPVPDDKRLVTIIEKDPAIAIYVLRQVNSAYYGLRRQVTEINRAVSLLGLKRVCNLVLAAALKQTFAYLEDSTAQTIYGQIIKTSVATAAFARDLATYLHIPPAEMAFTTGILHQLGRLVFLYSVPHLYLPLWQNGTAATARVSYLAPSRETEDARFNTDYLRLGASTLREWNLPEEFATVLSHLHAPAQTTDSQLRSLTLTVVAGQAATEELLLAGEAAIPLENRHLPGLLAALSEGRSTDVEELTGFLEGRKAVVGEFTQTVVADL